MRPIKTLAVLPTLFTLANLVCGFFAIVIASRVGAPTDKLVGEAIFGGSAAQSAQNCAWAGWLIFAAMIFDALDGHVARLAKVNSDFGAQLDSLCDAVTFGVAPGFLLVKLCPNFAFSHNKFVWIIAASFAVCAVLRLARFNVETSEDDDHMTFSGLPSPAAAATIAGFAILFDALQTDQPRPAHAELIYHVVQSVLPFFALGVALLMVSRISYPHLVNQVFRGQRSFNHLVVVVFALAVLAMVRNYAPAILCASFALFGPVRWAVRAVLSRESRTEQTF